MAGEVLDDFRDLSEWMAVTSGLAEMVISSAPGPSGAAMQLDFDFKGGGGFRIFTLNNVKISKIIQNLGF